MGSLRVVLRISAAAKAEEKRVNVSHVVLVIEICKICKMREISTSVCRKHLPLELGWDMGKHIKYSKHGARFYCQFTWISVLGGKHLPRRKQYRVIALLRPKAQVFCMKGTAGIEWSICCTSELILKLKEQEFK